jgi:protein-arginine kinase activator protein McsA
MEPCEVCGNEYDKAFEVRLAGQAHTFDSFECAIHALAPRESGDRSSACGISLKSKAMKVNADLLTPMAAMAHPYPFPRTL